MPECVQCVQDCQCPNTGCKRHGKCCECLASHRERNYFPFCVRPHKDVEHYPIWSDKPMLEPVD